MMCRGSAELSIADLEGLADGLSLIGRSMLHPSEIVLTHGSFGTLEELIKLPGAEHYHFNKTSDDQIELEWITNIITFRRDKS